MTTALAVQTGSTGLVYTDEQWSIIRTNFFPTDASDAEVLMCREQARRSGLDVFKKQAYFWRDKQSGKIIMVASVHGMRAHVDRRGGTIQSGAVHENDEFLCDPVTGLIAHKFRANGRGPVVGAWARGRLPGRDIVVKYVSFAEYKRSSPIWQEKPATMLEKTAVAHLSRALVPDALGDVYGAEEFGGESRDDFTVEMPTEPPDDPAFERIRECVDLLNKAESLAEIETARAGAVEEAKAKKWPESSKRLFKNALERRRAQLTAPAPAKPPPVVVDATGDRPPAEGEGE